jgi:hypothetical protein
MHHNIAWSCFNIQILPKLANQSPHQHQIQDPESAVDGNVLEAFPFEKGIGSNTGHDQKNSGYCSMQCTMFEGTEIMKSAM